MRQAVRGLPHSCCIAIQRLILVVIKFSLTTENFCIGCCFCCTIAHEKCRVLHLYHVGDRCNICLFHICVLLIDYFMITFLPFTMYRPLAG